MENRLRILVQVSLLVALEIVLSRFLSISAFNMKIGFGFVPILLCAMLYGPVWAGAAAAVADLLGALLFPIGPYFPGFTLTAALTGVVFGLFLYKREKLFPALAFAVGINCLVLSFGLNTVWIHILYGAPLLELFPVRALQCFVMIPIQLLLGVFCGMLCKLYKKRQYV